jgi:uncharacterized protein YjbI with pentapeptide repeats
MVAAHEIGVADRTQLSETLCMKTSPGIGLTMKNAILDQSKLDSMMDAHERWRQPDGSGQRLDLQSENLRGLALAGRSLIEAHLRGVDLSEANLYEAELDRAQIESVNLVGARLVKASIADAFLRDVELKGSDLTEATLDGAELRNCELFSAILSSASLVKVHANECRFECADFSAANLVKCYFSACSLRNANLTGADMSFAVFRDADLREANFDRVIFNRTRFRGVTRVHGITNFSGQPEKVFFEKVDFSPAGDGSIVHDGSLMTQER